MALIGNVIASFLAVAFIISAIVTPSPDMFNQTALALPMIGLYFLGVGVAYLFAKKTSA